MSLFAFFISSVRVILPTILLIIIPTCAFAQSSMPPDPSSAADAVERRIERARALAAAHQLQAATAELENVRASVNDLAVRNITTVMLMSIYLEEGNYGRAQALLEETFQARSSQKDESIRTYFALAGQAINGVRLHLERYRSYGINPSDRNLLPDAVADLERVRSFLERMIAQAQEVARDEGRSYDAVALQEDILGIRLSLARDSDDQDKWQTAYAAARERLASSQIQVASLNRPPALGSVTSRIPNPFATKPAEASSTGNSSTPEVSAGGAKPATAENAQSANAAVTTADPPLISTGTLSGRESKRVSPAYPALAKTTGVSGVVRVFAIVDEKGKVWVTNSEGPALLRRAAEDAARGWSFPPTIVSGKPARVAGYIDFEFKL